MSARPVNDSVEYETSTDGARATIWLNRPESRNAYHMDMLRGIERAIQRADNDPDVRVIIFRGRGDSFCVGGDPDMLGDHGDWQTLSATSSRFFHALEGTRKVTVAAVHGWVVGGGFEFMLACDFAVAADDARIGDFHIRNGLYPGGGSTYRLARLIGVRRAKEHILSGQLWSGVEATEAGVVNAHCPPVELGPTVVEYCAKFVDKSPTMLMFGKLAVNRGLTSDLDSMILLDQIVSRVAGEGRDAREGLEARQARRSPKWEPLPPSVSLIQEQGEE
ncbi:enoyl-CoA hydratase/isomerase family protein [Granulicoccus phenolivorans]|uniref:enoyl-CoA hydratase/isomerase family protein n=1 Tax=Granulicoccus phenolivorans TaxID=266854 RepID=UPI000687FBDC|nr:enoyl-CoA hydratase/isomerase family protein [Granulicoccus phenolivorans]